MFFSKGIICVSFAVLMSVGGAVTSAATLPSLHSVLKVVTYQEQQLIPDSYQEYSYGSAIALSSTKLLTNAHVILDENFKPIEYIAACMTDDAFVVPECMTTATVLAYDVDMDIALLELNEPIDVTPVEMNAAKLALNDYVQVLGYPSNGGGTITLTQGRISGKESELYKIDANLDGGNSGGGAFDENGKLIGIPVSVKRGYTSLGYMIPVERVKSFMENSAQFTHSSEINTVSFDAFIVGSHSAKKQSSIANDFFDFSRFGQWGYTVEDVQMLPSLGSYNYTFVSNDKKTTIVVAVSPYNMAPGDEGGDTDELLKAMRKVRKEAMVRDGVQFMDKEWTVIYADGYKGSEKPGKTLILVHDDGDFVYQYGIDTAADSMEQFRGALRALVYGYVIHVHGRSVDLHEFGELMLPEHLSISDPQPHNQGGIKMNLSYQDNIEGQIHYSVLSEGSLDTEKPEENTVCDWMGDEQNECQTTWIKNKNDITMQVTTFMDGSGEDLKKTYSVDIVDKYQDSYVQYGIIIMTDNVDTHKQRVREFVDNIGGDVQRVYQTKPATKTMQ